MRKNLCKPLLEDQAFHFPHETWVVQEDSETKPFINVFIASKSGYLFLMIHVRLKVEWFVRSLKQA